MIRINVCVLALLPAAIQLISKPTVYISDSIASACDQFVREF